MTSAEKAAVVAKGLSEAMAFFDAAMEDMGGCSDGNCIIKRPVGMHTNGGCKCHYDRAKMSRFGQHAALLAMRVRDHLQESDHG